MLHLDDPGNRAPDGSRVSRLLLPPYDSGQLSRGGLSIEQLERHAQSNAIGATS